MKKLIVIIAIVASLMLTGHTALEQTGDAQLEGTANPTVAPSSARRTGSRASLHRYLVTPRVFYASPATAFALSQGFTEAWAGRPNFGPSGAQHLQHSDTADIYNPAYRLRQSDVRSSSDNRAAAPARIAPVGFLDALRDAGTIKATPYLNVGYGTSEQVVVKKVGPTFPFDGIRKWTISGFHALDPRFIHLNQNLNQGYSGTGYGDSGGPTFVQTSSGLVVVAVVSTGDVPLYATSVNTRVDTVAVRDFLAPYLALR